MVACVVGDCVLHDEHGAYVIGERKGVLPGKEFAYILITQARPSHARTYLPGSEQIGLPLYTDKLSIYDRYGNDLGLDPNSTVILSADLVKDHSAVYRVVRCAELRHAGDACLDSLVLIDGADAATFRLTPNDVPSWIARSIPSSSRIAEDKDAYYNFTQSGSQAWIDRTPKNANR